VLDASRSVTVAGNLLNKELKKPFLEGLTDEYKKLREDFASKRATKQYISLTDAQKNGVKIDWTNFTAPKPQFTGTKVFDNYDLAEIRNYIDWGPFFIAWEMKGKYPDILKDEFAGKEATKLFNDANALLDKIINEKWLTARGVIGFWHTDRIAPDTIILKNEHGGEITTLEFLRQQSKKAAGQPNFSLADFICPNKAPSISPNWGGQVSHEEFYAEANPSLYPILKEFVSRMRKEPTEAENVLWQYLRSNGIENYSFRRQHIIGAYIADFVCLAKKLIIEVDGLIHQLPENIESDQQRTEWLESKGYKVIRFSNSQIIVDTDNVLKEIKEVLDALPFAERKNYDSTSSPVGGGQEGASDYMGAFAVSIHGIEPYIQKFQAAYDDYNKIMLQAMADRLAEAFAEVLHQKVRKEYWGYVKDEALDTAELVKETYQGIRPAPGYPACPDHTEKIKLFEILNATEVAGITLTESLAMYPGAAVCGWYFSHPQSTYFGIGKITDDQLHDYTKRKGMSLDEMKRWLSPILE